MPERLRPMLARARTASEAGDHRAAARGYYEAADKARSVELLGELAFCLRHGAQHSIENDQLRLALDAAEEAMSVYEQTETDKSLNFANTARLIALAMEGMERSHEARPYWEEARDIYDINGVKAGVDECDAHLSAATD
ncbi:hypothetical protein [Erythrobacter sp. NAP1]|uniref:hypothetical protein n=1 Tax=Erythrobacter sp. NAP1 TaxID=237727 RepID=UPI00138A1FD5|nr:hypothetical protein [Erythrobacter sp. NAP1]